MKNFSVQFDIIFEIYRTHARSAGINPSNISFARFLGHFHDGRIRAWKKGQWPSAEDLWQMHLKLGICLSWLVSGEGEPFAEAVTEGDARGGSSKSVGARNERLEAEVARKTEELAKVEKERDELLLELLEVQREHMKLLKERIGEKKMISHF